MDYIKLDIPLRDIVLNDSIVLDFSCDELQRKLSIETDGTILDGPVVLDRLLLKVEDWIDFRTTNYGENPGKSEKIQEIVITHFHSDEVTLEGYTESRDWVELRVIGGRWEVFGHKAEQKQEDQ